MKAQSINTNENQIDFLELQEKELMQELVQTLQNENYEFQQNQSNADINNVPDFAALQTTTSLELDQIDQIDLSMYQNIPLIDVEETSTANVPYFASQPITSSNNEELDQLDQIDLSLIQNFQLINFAETNITSLIECDEKDNIDGYLSENSNGEYNSCQSLISNSSKLNHNKVNN